MTLGRPAVWPLHQPSGVSNFLHERKRRWAIDTAGIHLLIGAHMRSGVLLSFVLLMAPMGIRLTHRAIASPTLSGASVSIETVSKADNDAVSIGVSVHAAHDHLIAAKRQIHGVWYEGSSFEAILDASPLLKSDFVGGDITLSPSRPLSEDWTYHCYVKFYFSDHSVIRIAWRDVKLRAGARSVTHNWKVSHCFPVEEPAQAEHPSCTLEMTFLGRVDTQSE